MALLQIVWFLLTTLIFLISLLFPYRITGPNKTPEAPAAPDPNPNPNPDNRLRYMTHPIVRLRQLGAQIRSERRTPRSLDLTKNPFDPEPARPGYRTRSFHEILSLKLVEAELVAVNRARTHGAGGGEVVVVPLSEVLESVVEHQVHAVCWWYRCFKYSLWSCGIRALLPRPWANQALGMWSWWREGVGAWGSELTVTRGLVAAGMQNDGGGGGGGDSARARRLVERVRELVVRGDRVIARLVRWRVVLPNDPVVGDLDDMIELMRLLGEISRCFADFYLAAAYNRVWSDGRNEAEAVGNHHEILGLD
ncbi:hypothetical protein F4778DRAFT_62461 [Xylariomycetidae sp. FL2044]|nr:hypothetical protein F4778DRAFT_62461 [Xylariomycetidae sp. FL2044]